jgi:hypothetical protein
MSAPPALIDAKAAARILCVSERTLRRIRHNGEICCVMVGGRVRRTA